LVRGTSIGRRLERRRPRRGRRIARRGGGGGGSTRHTRATVPLRCPPGGGDRATLAHGAGPRALRPEDLLPGRHDARDLRAAGFSGPPGRSGAEPRGESDALSLETSMSPTLRAACGRANRQSCRFVTGCLHRITACVHGSCPASAVAADQQGRAVRCQSRPR
jgi:hypothetical protein